MGCLGGRLVAVLVVACLTLAAACAEEGDDGPASADATVPAANGGNSEGQEEGGDRDDGGEPREVERPTFERIDSVLLSDPAYVGSGVAQWDAEVPGIAEVRISSTADDYEQPALWLAHDRDEPRPLLVVLHSWSVDYRQHVGIPYARWARQNDWAMIHPDFRGVLDGPDSTGSDLTVSDVLDAIDFAATHASIDHERVFITGFSGGGMMTLVMAGRHPERFAGAVAWVPIHDLVEWYAFAPGWAYARQIEASCGGDPTADAAAGQECRRRSPSAHLDAAREAGLPILLGHGLADTIVPPEHTAWAFNQLAAPDDRLGDDEITAIAAGEAPGPLDEGIETFFGAPDPQVRFAAQSGGVTAVFFDGEHTGVYNPGLEWILWRAAEVDAS